MRQREWVFGEIGSGSRVGSVRILARRMSELLGQYDLRVDRDVRPATPWRAAPLDVPIGRRETYAYIGDHYSLTRFKPDRVASSEHAGRFSALRSSPEAAASNGERGTA